jgi:hypothetical protein
MVLIQALFAWLGRSVGKVLNAIFGWAVVGLFGISTPREQAILSIIILGAVLWPLLAVGVFAPRVVAFLIAFVPPTRSIPSHVLRILWLTLVVVIPATIGVALAAKAPPGAERESTRVRIARGWPVTIGLAAAFTVMFFTVPVLRVLSIVRRWKDEHVPLITQGDEIDVAAERIDGVIRDRGLDARRAPAPWWLRAPAGVLRRLGGRTITALIPRDAFYWSGPTLQVALYPNQVLVRGPKTRAAWTHGLIEEAFARGPGLQTFDPKAQDLERQLHRIWQVLERDPRAHAGSPVLLGRIRDVCRSLARKDLAYDEWQVVYRKIGQLARAMDGEPQLLEWSADENGAELKYGAGG